MSHQLTSVNIVGAGPAGLYAAILLRKHFPAASIDVIERNPRGATFGFGVVFSDRALDFMQADAPELLEIISPEMERWSDMRLSLPSRVVTLDGIGFSAIGRASLLERLERYALELGVNIHYEVEVSGLDDLDADLIVGADGMNSIVRQSDPDGFLPSVSWFENRFAWFGANVTFETLTQTFVETPLGALNAHHYRYSSSMSTFIVECGTQTFEAYGFGEMDETESAHVCSEIFSDTLHGTDLITNRSQWRQFPKLWCKHWVSGNRVLLGDAAHSAHFSIGSGTRLAMEDAIALVRALVEEDDTETALGVFEERRVPIAKKITDASNQSAEWYDTFADKMRLDPLEFAKDYLMRSGRIDLDKLRTIAPRFMAEYDGER